jgi:hypothetical protein
LESDIRFLVRFDQKVLQRKKGFCRVNGFYRELVGGVELLGEIEEFGGGFGVAAVVEVV